MDQRPTPIELPHLRPFVPAPLFVALEPHYQTFQESQTTQETPDFEEFLGYLRREKLVTSDVLTLLSTLVLQLREAAGHTLTVGRNAATKNLKAVENPEPPKKVDSFGDFFDDTPTGNQGLEQHIDEAQQSKKIKVHPEELPVIEEKLGEGGMGIVYRVYNPTLERHEAIKQLRSKMPKDNLRKLRFFREAKVTALLNHPGIVPIHFLFDDFHGSPAYSMKVVEGEHLGRWIKMIHEASKAETPLPQDFSLMKRIQVFLRVCEAIHFAHNKGVLHRDIKPSNILLGAFGEVYVVDWGVAKVLNEAEDLTDEESPDSLHSDVNHTYSGQILGTPGYMSPEQAQGKNDELDPRSDLFALGMVLYELAYLQPARKGVKTIDVMAQALHGQVQLPEPSNVPWVPRELKAIIAKATNTDIEQRYPTVEHLMEDLQAFLQGESVSASPDSTLQQLLRLINRHGTRVLVWGLAIVAVLTAITAWALVERKQEQLRQTQANQQRFFQYSEVMQQARHLDRKLFRFEKRLGKLAAATRVSLLHAEAKQSDIHLHQNFTTKDLSYSAYYKDKVSLQYPVFKLAPKLEPKVLEPQLLKLAQVSDYLHNVVLYDGEAKQRSYIKRADLEKELLDGKLPIVSAFVGTTSGIMMLYPGRGSYPDSYDNRLRPWFRTGLGQRSIRWSPPYISSQKIRQMLVACTQSINDNHNKPMAVVGFDISLNVLASFLEGLIQKSPWIDSAMLVNEKGQVLVKTGRRYHSREAKGVISKTPQFAKLPMGAQLQTLLTQQNESWLQWPSKEGRRVVTFTRLKTLPWSYVVVGKPGKQ